MANFRSRPPAVRQPISYPLDTYLTWVAYHSRVSGFVSRTDARTQGVTSTADLAWDATRGITDPNSGLTPQDRRLGEDAAAWARGMNPESEYDRKLQEVAESEVVTPQTLGTAGSMVRAYQRAVEDKARLRGAANGWVGEVGEVFSGVVTVDEVKPFTGRGGRPCWLVKSRASASDYPVTFFVNDTTLTPGDQVLVEGRIKTCGEFRGRKETTLTRAKVI